MAYLEQNIPFCDWTYREVIWYADTVGLADKNFWLRVMCFGAIAVPTLFRAFVLKITQQESRLSARYITLLSVQPLAIVVVIWSDIHLIFGRIDLEMLGGLTVLHVERGIGLWVNTYSSYAIILLALLILGGSSLQANPFFRRLYLIILAASIIPFAASIFTQTNYTELADLDMAPISFDISSVLFGYAVFCLQFMDLLPVACGHLIESMSEGVLVLDEHGRIVDINPAMQNILDEAPASNIKKFLGSLHHYVIFS